MPHRLGKQIDHQHPRQNQPAQLNSKNRLVSASPSPLLDSMDLMISKEFTSYLQAFALASSFAFLATTASSEISISVDIQEPWGQDNVPSLLDAQNYRNQLRVWPLAQIIRDMSTLRYDAHLGGLGDCPIGPNQRFRLPVDFQFCINSYGIEPRQHFDLSLGINDYVAIPPLNAPPSWKTD